MLMAQAILMKVLNMKPVEYPEFLSFLSSFPFETEGLFDEQALTLTYINKLTGVAVARCKVSDTEEPYMHHGIYCKDFEVSCV